MLERFLTNFVTLLSLSSIIPRSFSPFGTCLAAVVCKKDVRMLLGKMQIFFQSFRRTSYLKLILPNQYIKFHKKMLNEHKPKNYGNIGENQRVRQYWLNRKGNFVIFNRNFSTGKCAYYHFAILHRHRGIRSS